MAKTEDEFDREFQQLVDRKFDEMVALRQIQQEMELAYACMMENPCEYSDYYWGLLERLLVLEAEGDKKWADRSRGE